MERGGPKDVRKILEDGKMELLGAYYLGDEECTDYAWSIFANAIKKAKDSRETMHWIDWQDADLGFFADAAEVLGDLCSRFVSIPEEKSLPSRVDWSFLDGDDDDPDEL